MSGRFVVMCLGVMGLVMGCAQGTGTEPNEDVTPNDVTDSLSTPLDTGSQDTFPRTDIIPGPPYPGGPFGYGEGKVIKDLGFYAPFIKEEIWLHQWYQDPKVKLLMLLSTVGW